MKLHAEHLYHIYTRGNNSQRIFFKRENYLFFLQKVRVQLLPHMDFLAYCLMPNHFHFLVQTKKDYQVEEATNAFRVLLSSYTRAINKQEDRTGSLFQQNAKAKSLEEKANYPFICFHYIHQNPMSAGLVSRIEDWEYSSFRDFINLRNGTLCKQTLARQLIGLPQQRDFFYKEAYQVIDSYKIDAIL